MDLRLAHQVRYHAAQTKADTHSHAKLHREKQEASTLHEELQAPEKSWEQEMWFPQGEHTKLLFSNTYIQEIYGVNWLYLYVYIRIYKYIYAFNYNGKRCHEFEDKWGEVRGKVWKEEKEGNIVSKPQSQK